MHINYAFYFHLETETFHWKKQRQRWRHSLQPTGGSVVYYPQYMLPKFCQGSNLVHVL